MFALKCPVVHHRFKKPKISKVCRSYYNIDDSNSKPLENVKRRDLFHILSFEHEDAQYEGIYAVTKFNVDDLPINNIVAFTNFDDVFRYKTLLEAEMDKKPFIQFATRFELEYMCDVGNYKCIVVNENVLVTPPTMTERHTDWERRTALLSGRWSVREKGDNNSFEWP